MAVFHGGLGRAHYRRRRRPAGEAQYAGACGGAGAGRRQRQRDRGDRRYRRRHSRPDPALATLPISVMAVGMSGRARFRSGCWPRPSAAASRCRPARCSASSPASSRALRCCRIVPAPALGYVVRRSLCRRPSIVPLCRRRYRERAFPRQSGVLGFGRRHFCRRDRAAARHSHQGRWPAYLFAGTYLAQSACAACRVVLAFLKIPKLSAVRSFTAGRPLSEIVLKPRFIVAATCGLRATR